VKSPRAKLQVIVVGRLATPAWIAAQRDYQARIQRYQPVELIEIKDHHGRTTPDADARAKEGRLLRGATEAPCRILLTPAGQIWDSLAFAQQLTQWLTTYPQLAFWIGGPSGVSPELAEVATHTWSLSPLTFPHELARIVLLEQLYRALTLQKGEKYHKA